jgi:hypothetical protein
MTDDRTQILADAITAGMRRYIIIGTSTKGDGSPPFEGPWHVIDTSTAEPEVNWPGDVVDSFGTADEAWKCHMRIIAEGILDERERTGLTTAEELNTAIMIANEVSAECERQAMMLNDGEDKERTENFRVGADMVCGHLRRAFGRDPEAIPFDLVAHLARQRAFSLKTFGPGARHKMVLDHIEKELKEIRDVPYDVTEWIDLVLLAFDGALRTGASPRDVANALKDKLTINERRDWPDWRVKDPNKAITHLRTTTDREAHGRE